MDALASGRKYQKAIKVNEITDKKFFGLDRDGDEVYEGNFVIFTPPDRDAPVKAKAVASCGVNLVVVLIHESEFKAAYVVRTYEVKVVDHMVLVRRELLENILDLLEDSSVFESEICKKKKLLSEMSKVLGAGQDGGQE